MSFFGALVSTLKFLLSRRVVAQKKALLLGFLDVRTSFHEAQEGCGYNVSPTEHHCTYFTRAAFLPR